MRFLRSRVGLWRAIHSAHLLLGLNLVGTAVQKMLTLAIASASGAALAAWALDGMRGSDDEGVRALVSAGADGRLYEITELVERSGVSPESRAADGTTALYAAAAAGHAAAVRLLLELGANPRTKCSGGAFALHAAARHGKLEAFRILYEHDISSVACQDSEGLQSLHVASQHGQLAMVEALLSIGASVNARTTLQQTPLLLAATCCAYDGEAAAACLRVLLDHGADVAARDASGDTALHIAVRSAASSERGVMECLALLCDRGAPLFVENQHGVAPLDLALGAARGLLDQAFTSRLRKGHAEANAANAARARLARRAQSLARDDPAMLEALWSEPGTARLLRRFGLGKPLQVLSGVMMDDVDDVGTRSTTFDTQTDVVAEEAPATAHEQVGGEIPETQAPTPPTARATRRLVSLLEELSDDALGQ